MSVCEVLSRRLHSEVQRTAARWRHTQLRSLCTPATPTPEKTSYNRTTVTDPVSHGVEHIGMWYNIPHTDYSTIFHGGGLTNVLRQQMKAMHDNSLMVRPPALKLIKHLHNTNLKHPVVRYVIYGRAGVGKSCTMAHTLHYAHLHNWILFHVPWFPVYCQTNKELQESTHTEGYTDMPWEAALWLANFKLQNEAQLKELNLVTSKEVMWSKKESVPAGSPLMQVVEEGLKQPKFATDACGVIARELRIHSSQGRCKTLVAIDGVNAMFHAKSHVYNESRVNILPKHMSVTRIFKKMLNNDWSGGAVVVVADIRAKTRNRDSYLPRFLLEREGFELLNPFVPILVSGYNTAEYSSCMDYYEDMRWIQHPATKSRQGREEIKFISGLNPFDIQRLTAVW